MRSIQLERLVIRHFRSFRTQTEIELSTGAGLKYLTGDNQTNPRLDGNGAGKSTLWDAVCYCLYGVSVRGIRAADLTTWGESAPMVEAHWLIAGETAVIMRQGSPNKITINGLPADQLAIDRLIGLTRGRFLQSVIFGQGAPLFIDLSGPERGALLDEILDLGLWLRAADTASRRHTELSDALTGVGKEVAYLEGKLAGLESQEDIQAAIDAWEREQEGRIEQAIANVAAAEERLNELKLKVVTTANALAALPTRDHLEKQVRIHQQAKADREAQYREFFAKLQEAQKKARFYQANRTCPECAQAIPHTHSGERMRHFLGQQQSLETSIKGNGAQTRGIVQTLERLTGDLDKLRRKHEFLQEQRATAIANLRAHENLIQGAERACEIMMEAVNPHLARQKQVEADIAAAKAELKALQGKKRRLHGQAIKSEFWKAAFKRVRLFMVKRVLAQLEAETAAAAAALGLTGWRIYFSTEIETKSGTFKQGVHIQVSVAEASAPWEAWSGGEGHRVRLAVALGLASLIQRQAGVSIDFEVWDEPTQFLSAGGIDDLLLCLAHRAKVHRKSLWLCDHRALAPGLFAEIWQVAKTEAGSSVKLLTSLEA